jgi:N-acetylmuramoyl-L-alanine amidase
LAKRCVTLIVLASLALLSIAGPLPAEARPALVGTGKTVYIDPGHGGIETGAVHAGPDGKVNLIERDLNLKIGLKLRALLERDGFRVAMSRETAESPNTPPIDRNGDGRVTSRDEYQAVVDKAIDSKADLFVSIHNNGAGNKDASGTEVWFSPLRAFADKNLLFARLLQANLVASIHATGYNSVDRGIKDDSTYRVFNGRLYEIFVIGEADNTQFHPRAASIPGALGESLFLSNEADAAMLAKESTLDAIAQGYYNAIVQYFNRLAQGGALEWPVPASLAAGVSARAPAPVPVPLPTPTPTPVPVRPVPPNLKHWLAQ